MVGNEEKDSQGWKADSKNESCQVQDPSAPIENKDRRGSEPVSELDFVTNSQMDCQMDRAEIKELNRLCGRSNVQRWLATVGVGKLLCQKFLQKCPHAFENIDILAVRPMGVLS